MQFRTTGLLLLGAVALPAPRDRTNQPRSTGNYTNRGCRNQIANRRGRAAPFQSGEHHSSAGREDGEAIKNCTQKIPGPPGR